MDARQERGKVIADRFPITQKLSGLWEVPSESRPTKYLIDLRGEKPRCTCPDHENRRADCKHIHAVRFAIERAERCESPPVPPRPVPPPARPTFKQVWPAYNAAQVHEKEKFQTLLHDLCRTIEGNLYEPKPGQKALRLADAVFAVVFKVYSTFSSRRFQTDLREARAKGYIEKAPHFNSIFNYLQMPGLTPILQGLIAASSLPLRAIEQDFAVDSSGFGTSRFDRWYEAKYGTVQMDHTWVKVHICCGVVTNVVTAVEIKGKRAADAPEFPGLVKATARNFTIREVSADGVYASDENFKTVAGVGGTGYLAFRDNATGAKGGLYEKMFHVFSLNRDDYLKHYHKRSNVESTFGMVKAKFGDSLRSKMDMAMKNEALCKFICHNICCVIQAIYELGIEPVFWVEETQPKPDVSSDAEAWAWV